MKWFRNSKSLRVEYLHARSGKVGVLPNLFDSGIGRMKKKHGQGLLSSLHPLRSGLGVFTSPNPAQWGMLIHDDP